MPPNTQLLSKYERAKQQFHEVRESNLRSKAANKELRAANAALEAQLGDSRARVSCVGCVWQCAAL
jgi:hypothetical protein